MPEDASNIVCPCGCADDFDRELVMIPLTFRATCRACGAETSCSFTPGFIGGSGRSRKKAGARTQTPPRDSA